MAAAANLLMAKNEESDVEVTWEDQQRIHTFNKLHIRVTELRSRLDVKTKAKQAIEDATNEILLADEDDDRAIMFTVGNSFVHMDKESLESRLGELAEQASKEVRALTDQVRQIEGELSKLKATLYAKFKNQINLETD